MEEGNQGRARNDGRIERGSSKDRGEQRWGEGVGHRTRKMGIIALSGIRELTRVKCLQVVSIVTG